MRLLIVGAGGHGQVVADIIRASHSSDSARQLVGYVDDDARLHGLALLGITVLGPIGMIAEIPHDGIVVALGDNTARKRVSELLLADGRQLVEVIHPSAILAPDVTVAAGAMICAGVVVNTGTDIGSGAILNTSCSIDHHSRVGSYAHVAPGVHAGGEVRIGEGALIGIGAVIIPRRVVGAFATVGAGAAVIDDVPDHVTVVGNPARQLRAPVNR
jgi:sugar O-acyltransferase (sialic acid O-acetyltransferase NeuD family)